MTPPPHAPTPDPDGDPGEDVVAVVLSRSSETVQEVRIRFATAGFTVGPASGPTFAVQAPTRTFVRAFGVLPLRAGDGGWTTEGGDELPLGGLPGDLRREVAAVALERPSELHGPVL